MTPLLIKWNFVTCVGVVCSIFVGVSNARYLAKSAIDQQQAESIPTFLLRMYNEMGSEKFQQTWKAFNNRNSDQQDAFLTEGLTDDELEQLGSDFESFALALSEDHKLMELYADFEHNLDIAAFIEMNTKLNTPENQGWWSRIKRFLYRKLKKLAQEMINGRTNVL